MHCIRTISALRRILPVLALLLASGPPLVAEDAAAEAAAPAPDWKLELGLSYLATSGNSETASGGLKATASKEWDPWSLEAGAYFLRAEDKGETTAERYGASIGGARALSEHWGVTAGWSGEKDRFSGIDFRSVLSAGTQWKMLESESWKLDSRAALTWTTEDFGGDLPSNDYLGGLLGLSSAWKLTSAADLTTKLVYFPNFDQSDDYRLEGDLALTTKISTAWALALGYQVRYDNVPVPGFERTDTATTASLVLKLPVAPAR